MTRPEIVARRIGTEGEPVVTIDGFHPDPGGLRGAAATARFQLGRHHYPGIRAALPADYFARVRPALGPVLREVFGAAATDLIDASFSIVTRPPDLLEPVQRLPHVDAIEPGRLALVHYLSPGDGDGTMFYRHRQTGFETITAERAPRYHATLRAELARDGAPPAAYIAGDSAQFEAIAAVSGRYNRAVVYRSALLHSGAIAPDAILSDDPTIGRLTVTAFLIAR